MDQRLQRFAKYTDGDLKWAILRREDDLELQRACVKELRKLHTTRTEHQALLEQVHFRAGENKWCSLLGGYSLAKKRAMGMASARTTVAMAAGEDHQGQVQDCHTVSRFEHRLSIAKYLQAKHAYDTADVDCLEFVQGGFDATQQDASSGHQTGA